MRVARQAPRFHCATPLAAGRRIALPDAVFHHALRVRRLRAGDDVVLFNGEGVEASARLVRIGRDGADVDVLSVEAADRESPLDVTLIQGISSGERMDYTLQKAVELGVNRIVPVFAERSVVRLEPERADKRLAHWRQVVVGACEQCGRNRIPEVELAVPLPDAIDDPRFARSAQRFMLAVAANARLRDVPPPARPIVLLAGPEGGLAPHEQQRAITAGFEPLSLGPRVLRTETAAVAALAAMQALWGDG